MRELRKSMFEIKQQLAQPDLSQDQRANLEGLLFDLTQSHKRGEETLERAKVIMADLKRQETMNNTGLEGTVAGVILVVIFILTGVVFDAVFD